MKQTLTNTYQECETYWKGSIKWSDSKTVQKQETREQGDTVLTVLKRHLLFTSLRD